MRGKGRQGRGAGPGRGGWAVSRGQEQGLPPWTEAPPTSSPRLVTLTALGAPGGALAEQAPSVSADPRSSPYSMCVEETSRAGCCESSRSFPGSLPPPARLATSPPPRGWLTHTSSPSSSPAGPPGKPLPTKINESSQMRKAKVFILRLL